MPKVLLDSSLPLPWASQYFLRHIFRAIFSQRTSVSTTYASCFTDLFQHPFERIASCGSAAPKPPLATGGNGSTPAAQRNPAAAGHYVHRSIMCILVGSLPAKA